MSLELSVRSNIRRTRLLARPVLFKFIKRGSVYKRSLLVLNLSSSNRDFLRESGTPGRHV